MPKLLNLEVPPKPTPDAPALAVEQPAAPPQKIFLKLGVANRRVIATDLIVGVVGNQSVSSVSLANGERLSVSRSAAELMELIKTHAPSGWIEKHGRTGFNDDSTYLRRDAVTGYSAATPETTLVNFSTASTLQFPAPIAEFEILMSARVVELGRDQSMGSNVPALDVLNYHLERLPHHR